MVEESGRVLCGLTFIRDAGSQELWVTPLCPRSGAPPPPPAGERRVKFDGDSEAAFLGRASPLFTHAHMSDQGICWIAYYHLYQKLPRTRSLPLSSTILETYIPSFAVLHADQNVFIAHQ